MKCHSCHEDIPFSARFCPSCAEPVLKEVDIKSPVDISAEWIKGILEIQGYSVKIDEEDQNVIMARHEQNPNLVVGLKKNLSLITVQSSWHLKKPGWGQKSDFLAAINKANSLHWLCACYTSDSMDDLNISAAMYLAEKLSSRDVISFIDMFTEGVRIVIKNSGISRFS